MVNVKKPKKKKQKVDGGLILEVKGVWIYIIPCQYAVKKLEGSDGHQEDLESVNELCPLRRGVEVVLGQVLDDLVPGLVCGGARGFGGGGGFVGDGGRDGRDRGDC